MAVHEPGSSAPFTAYNKDIELTNQKGQDNIQILNGDPGRKSMRSFA